MTEHFEARPRFRNEILYGVPSARKWAILRVGNPSYSYHKQAYLTAEVRTGGGAYTFRYAAFLGQPCDDGIPFLLKPCLDSRK
jgi:hypothetical protein